MTELPLGLFVFRLTLPRLSLQAGPSRPLSLVGLKALAAQVGLGQSVRGASFSWGFISSPSSLLVASFALVSWCRVGLCSACDPLLPRKCPGPSLTAPLLIGLQERFSTSSF